MPQLPWRPTSGGRSRSPCCVFVAGLVALSFVTACRRDLGDAEPREASVSTAPVARAADGDPVRGSEDDLARRVEEGDALVAEGDDESCRHAVRLYLEAVELSRSLERPAWEAVVLQRLGRVHRKFLEQRREAIAYYGGALALYEELGEVENQVTVLLNLGRLHFRLGEMETTLELWERARELVRRSDRDGEAAVLNNLALAARYRGDAQKALTFYDRSLELLAELDRREEHGRAFFNRGRLYETLGQDRPARADFERALAIGREVGQPRLQAMVLTALGRMRETDGDLEGALALLREASSLRRAAEEERGRAVTRLALASVYEKLGRRGEAREVGERALAVFRRHQARRQVAQTRVVLARLDLEDGEVERAVGHLAEARAEFRRLGDPAGEIRAGFVAAQAERARGRLSAALERSTETLDALESLRRRAATHDLRRSFAAAHRDPYDFHVDLLMELHRREPGGGFDARALETAERSRARSLRELLIQDHDALRADADPGLLERERKLEGRLALLESRRLDLLDGDGTASEVELWEERIDEALRELRALRGRIFAGSPRYASLARPPRVTPDDVRRSLEQEAVLLEYHLGRERSFLWAVTQDGIESFELPPRAAVEAAARRAHELLRRSRQRRYRRATGVALAALGGLVLDPAAAVLRHRRQVLVVADGALHYVPFAALPAPGAEPPAPLLSSHEVVHLPSASTRLLLRDPHRRAGRPPAEGLVAVVADPVFQADDPRLGDAAGPGNDAAGGFARGLSRLRHASREAESILRQAAGARSFVALGPEASREVVVDPALGRYRVVHLATHGVIDAERPELSQLVFSRFDAAGSPRRGSLLAHEIFGLDLGAELVVLSACETALGDEVRGEGLVGLTQAFLSAGPSAVLVSLWQADDRATVPLMEDFYRRLFAGDTPAEALRHAQLVARSDAGRNAPYYWAGFVLVGEGRSVVAAKPR